MKRLAFLIMLCQQVFFASADIVTGRIVDADTGAPLADAKVDVEIFPVNEYYCFIHHLSADSCGRFSRKVETMSRVTINVNYFGYEAFSKKLNVAGGKDTLDLGDIKLKMSAELLDEVLVKAKARKFTMKGDTIVFNPEAFNLDDGERIATLLTKLPGVSIKDNKLYFMDKEVHLKVNGHDAADQMLTSLLPAEAVKNIKAYEKESELAEKTGMSDGQEEQVLDITIKPGFMDKWYGQTKLGAYASDNYLAAANLHYLTDKNPLNIYARVSDCGSKTTSVWGENAYSWKNDIPQRQHFGNASYKRNWKPSFMESSSRESSWSITVTPNHNDTYQHSWTSTETFLSGENSTFSNGSGYNYNHLLNIPLSFDATLHLGPKSLLRINMSGGFTRNSSHNTSEQQTFHSEEFADTLRQLVNSSSQERMSTNDKGFFNSRLEFIHTMKRSDFGVTLSADYTKEDGKASSHTDYDYYELGTTESLVMDEKSDGNWLQTIVDARYNYQIVPKKVRLGVAYWMDYWRKEENVTYLRNGEHDLANSYDRMKSYLVNEPRVEINADLDKVWLHALVKMQNVYETMDYNRGRLDTLTHRTTWFPRPMFEFKWKNTKTTEVKGSVNWEYSVADLLSSMAFTDDTNPLYVIKGNPALKASSTLNSSLSYSKMFVKGQQMLSMTLGYTHSFDPVTNMSVYNAQTGGYTTSATNTDDSQSWRFKVTYDRSLGGDFRLYTRANVSQSRDYGIKTMTSTDDPVEQFRRRETSGGGVVDVSFQNKSWETAVWVSADYHGNRYSDPTLSKLNLWDYNTGLRGAYKTKQWIFWLTGKCIVNTGYLSDLMNRNRFSLDASVVWKIMKNHGQLALELSDILNQMADTRSSSTINTRTDTKNETFHRYASLTFTYNFDAKAKKGK